MFAVPSFFGYNTTFVSTPVATAATGVGSTSFTANWNAFAGASYYLLDVSTSSSFSSFVGSYQNFVVLSTSQLVSGLTASTTYYYRLRAATGVDADAAAFFSRVYTAGGALSYTEVSATETLVADLKANSLWTPMKAIYPMVGASAAACAQNLKSSSFTGTFTSGWTFASTGIKGNGTSAYFDTTFNPSTNASLTGFSFGGYPRNNDTSGTQVSGCFNSNFAQHNLSNGNIFSGSIAEIISYTANPSQKMFIHRRTSASFAESYSDGTSLGTATTTAIGLPNINFTVGARNQTPVTIFDAHEYAFYFLGLSLTNTNALNLTSAVNTFQTTLSRQV